MKIVHISIYPKKGGSDPNMGGVAWYTKKLIKNIPSKKDDEVFILCNKIDGKKKEFYDGRIKIIRCLDRNVWFVFQALRETQKINPDTVHIQQELHLYGGLLTAWLLQWLVFSLKKYKRIVTLHGVVSLKIVTKEFVRENNSRVPVFLAKIGFITIFKPLLKFSDLIIVHEVFFKDILVKEYLAQEDKIKVINLGVDKIKPVDKAKARRVLGVGKHAKVVLFLGYLTGYKGLDLLIDSFSEFIKKEKEGFLIIASGKHPKLKTDKRYLRMYEGYMKKAKKLLPKNHRWVGFVPDNQIKNYFSAVDLTIYPYTACISSSGPMSIGMGYGKPFLVSEVFSGIIKNKNMIFKREIKDLVSVLSSFFKNQKSATMEIKKIRENRAWTKIGAKTYNTYQLLLK